MARDSESLLSVIVLLAQCGEEFEITSRAANPVHNRFTAADGRSLAHHAKSRPSDCAAGDGLGQPRRKCNVYTVDRTAPAGVRAGGAAPVVLGGIDGSG